MSDNEKDAVAAEGGAASRGADWEGVTLTASGLTNHEVQFPKLVLEMKHCAQPLTGKKEHM